jgi:hypothetical protein
VIDDMKCPALRGCPADIIAVNSAATLLFDDMSSVAETLAALRVERRIIAAGIYRIDGQQFAIYERQTPPGAMVLPAEFGHGSQTHDSRQ